VGSSISVHEHPYYFHRYSPPLLCVLAKGCFTWLSWGTGVGLQMRENLQVYPHLNSSDVVADVGEGPKTGCYVGFLLRGVPEGPGEWSSGGDRCFPQGLRHEMWMRS
jgi:hypothetical protein